MSLAKNCWGQIQYSRLRATMRMVWKCSRTPVRIPDSFRLASMVFNQDMSLIRTVCFRELSPVEDWRLNTMKNSLWWCFYLFGSIFPLNCYRLLSVRALFECPPSATRWCNRLKMHELCLKPDLAPIPHQDQPCHLPLMDSLWRNVLVCDVLRVTDGFLLLTICVVTHILQRTLFKICTNTLKDLIYNTWVRFD